MNQWEFWIDAGGTFMDCIAKSPEGKFSTHKLLSSGVTKGKITRQISDNQFNDPIRNNDPSNFWKGYTISIFGQNAQLIHESTITNFDSQTGSITFQHPFQQNSTEGLIYELSCDDEAPIVAIRYLLGLGLNELIPKVSVRFGTTRGTNALLTRNGAKAAFITTTGFAEILLIAYQDRPRLFDLDIQKPEALFEQVVEINERLNANGDVIMSPNESEIRSHMHELKKSGIESIAICLLHSYINPTHELLIARIAREAGFSSISVSSQLSPLIKIVSRGDTTLVDAYLNPVLNQYIHNLKQSLKGCDIKIMTSAGGLVDADHFSGKDSILSGPAGGVIGVSHAARNAGYYNVIGFDMGGTSTDVARYDGSYEREYETKKAGVRIVSPMLAIETVAAGGGSICKYDGVKLTVGPDSASADPGPACYGKGGPLTVTDMNLYTGKIITDRFPFPLDKNVVEEKLQALCDQINQSSDTSAITTTQLAAGFLKVANANMVRAVRNISVAKGYNPKDHVLVTFGGAGAQHACAVARSLGIQQILIHPYAGILSAYGIGMANVSRFAEHAVLKPYKSHDDHELESLFKSLESKARTEVIKQGISDNQINPPIRSLDLRYQGAESTINVSQPSNNNYKEKFEQLHNRQFGFTRMNHPIEIVTARVEVVGETVKPAVIQNESIPRQPEPALTTRTCFEEDFHDTGVFYREDIRAGDQFTGPAIVCEPTSTIIIDPGFSAEILDQDEILITDQSEKTQEQVSQQVDPVMLEIFNNLFASIAEQMGTMLEKTAFSTNVKERRDFSCAVFSSKGDLVANAPHIPVHLGAMSETVRCIISNNPAIKPGDVFLTNDPYRGGSHLPDLTVITPVHDHVSDEIIFFTASRAHHAEIGGIVPGSLPPFSTNLAEEGVLIREFKLFDAGNSREPQLIELLTTAQYPTRSVYENLADISAQVAANHQGVQLLNDLISQYSQPVVLEYMKHIQNAAAKKMRMALADIPDGVYQRTDHLDDGSPISVSITINEDQATVDFTGTGPVVPGNLNANRSIVTAAVLYVFRCLLQEDIPLNSGVLEPVDIIIPTCLLNPPQFDDPEQCAAVVGGNVETSSRVVDVLLGALEIAAASQGTMNNLTFGDDTFGYYETICGGSGATQNADGADAVHTHMTNTRLTDPEVIEHRYPVRIREFKIRRGSGGKGQHCGGDGITRKIEFLKPLQVSLLTERRGAYLPFGLHGGEAGELGKNTIQRHGRNEEEILPAKSQLEVQPGDILTIHTPGGGGNGVKKESSID